MKAFEIMGNVDENGQLLLDMPLEINLPSRVKVIVLVADESDADDTPVEEIKAGLKRALQNVKVGRTKPISELWDRIDD